MTEAGPNTMPNRTRFVHVHERRSSDGSGARDTTRCTISGSGEIRTHGTLSRTHTFQTGYVSRFHAHVLREASLNLRVGAAHSNDRGCASNRTRSVHTAHSAPRHYSASKTASNQLEWTSFADLFADLGVDENWWLIAGGESQPGARPAAIAWFRTLRDECWEYAVPFFLKQLGGHPDSRAHDAAVLDGERHVEVPISPASEARV